MNKPILYFLLLIYVCIPYTTSAQTAGDIFFEKGKEFFEDSYLDSAIHYFERALRVEPNHEKANFTMGLSLYETKQFNKAKTYFVKTTRINPDAAFAYMFRALCEYDLEQYNLALRSITDAIRLHPTHGEMFILRASIRHHLNQQDECCEDLDRAYILGAAGIWEARKKYGCVKKSLRVNTFDEVEALAYEIRKGDTHYFVHIDVTKFAYPQAIKFDWSMSHDDEMAGSIQMSLEALHYATAQMNHFYKGDVKLTEQTSLWLSREAFARLKNGETLIMDTGREELPFAISRTTSYTTRFHEQTSRLSVVEILNEATGQKLLVLDNPFNPLILSMELEDWAINIIGILSHDD